MITPTRTPEFIYKVASREIYDASLEAGSFVGQPIDLQDGYVHLSSAAQLGETIGSHGAIAAALHAGA